MSKRIRAITSENKIVETYESISYCGLVFDMSPYKIKCLIENETEIEHPANLGKVTLKFALLDDTTEDKTSDNTESEFFKNITGDETLEDTTDDADDNDIDFDVTKTGGYKKGYSRSVYKNRGISGIDISVLRPESTESETSDNTESLMDKIKQLNAKIKSLQDIIEGYNDLYESLVDEHETKILKLENENTQLKNQCNLMILYLNKIRRKVGFYLYEDYIMKENDVIKLKEKLENIINRVAPKSDNEN